MFSMWQGIRLQVNVFMEDPQEMFLKNSNIVQKSFPSPVRANTFHPSKCVPYLSLHSHAMEKKKI